MHTYNCVINYIIIVNNYNYHRTYRNKGNSSPFFKRDLIIFFNTTYFHIVKNSHTSRRFRTERRTSYIIDFVKTICVLCNVKRNNQMAQPIRFESNSVRLLYSLSMAHIPSTKSEIYSAGEPFQSIKLEARGFSTWATKLLSQFKPHVEGELFPLNKNRIAARLGDGQLSFDDASDH